MTKYNILGATFNVVALMMMMVTITMIIMQNHQVVCQKRCTSDNDCKREPSGQIQCNQLSRNKEAWHCQQVNIFYGLAMNMKDRDCSKDKGVCAKNLPGSTCKSLPSPRKLYCVVGRCANNEAACNKIRPGTKCEEAPFLKQRVYCLPGSCYKQDKKQCEQTNRCENVVPNLSLCVPTECTNQPEPRFCQNKHPGTVCKEPEASGKRYCGKMSDEQKRKIPDGGPCTTSNNNCRDGATCHVLDEAYGIKMSKKGFCRPGDKGEWCIKNGKTTDGPKYGKCCSDYLDKAGVCRPYPYL